MSDSIRERVDRRDELARRIEEAVYAEIRYDEDDWTRIADVVMPLLAEARAQALREAADAIAATDSQKGIGSRALSPGKAFAVDWLRDKAGR